MWVTVSHLLSWKSAGLWVPSNPGRAILLVRANRTKPCLGDDAGHLGPRKLYRLGLPPLLYQPSFSLLLTGSRSPLRRLSLLPNPSISPNECHAGKINPPQRPLPHGIRRLSREDGCNDTLGDRFASLGDEARLHLIRNPPYLPGHYFTHYLFILAGKRREKIPLRACHWCA